MTDRYRAVLNCLNEKTYIGSEAIAEITGIPRTRVSTIIHALKRSYNIAINIRPIEGDYKQKEYRLQPSNLFNPDEHSAYYTDRLYEEGEKARWADITQY